MPIVYDAWFFEIFIFFFFWKDDDDDLSFLKMYEAWPNAPSSRINLNFEKSYCVGTLNKAKFE